MDATMLRVANVRSAEDIEAVRDALDGLGASYEHVESDPEDTYPQTAYFQVSSDFDDATLIGGPPTMVEGKLADLRRADSVIVDDVGAGDKLARTLPDGTKIPLKVGDTLELNDHRAVVAVICMIASLISMRKVVMLEPAIVFKG